MIGIDAIARVVQRLTAPLARRVRLMVARGVIELVDDSLKLQAVQLTTHADDVDDGIERFQQYGFTSHPEPGAEAVVLAVGGSCGHRVVTNVDDRRYRPKDLEEGEVALYNRDGILVCLDKDGILNLAAKAASDALALASKVDARVDALQQAHDSHIHQTTATIGPSPTVGVIATTASPVGQLESTASDKVKAE